MVAGCYYFYALNSFHVGTLSWDILLVTLFLMCVTGYHSDYFSVDSLLRKDEFAFRTKRPYFIQRLLQFQIGFTFFYTAIVKIYPRGNWLTDNPIHYIMNYPPSGTTKWFLIRDYLMTRPDLCYAIGIFVIVTEFLMIFLLFWRKTRISAIYLGIIFHITLILTLDVPATFFFLFPPMLLLFINPDHLLNWIEEKRKRSASGQKYQLIYDGQCRFCMNSVHKLKIMDVFDAITYIDLHAIDNLSSLHPQLDKQKALSQLQLIDRFGNLSGGFHAIRKLCFVCPMMLPLSLIFYFPGMGVIGPVLYKIVAKNRYIFHFNKTCRTHTCFHKKS